MAVQVPFLFVLLCLTTLGCVQSQDFELESPDNAEYPDEEPTKTLTGFNKQYSNPPQVHKEPTKTLTGFNKQYSNPPQVSNSQETGTIEGLEKLVSLIKSEQGAVKSATKRLGTLESKDVELEARIVKLEGFLNNQVDKTTIQKKKPLPAWKPEWKTFSRPEAGTNSKPKKELKFNFAIPIAHNNKPEPKPDNKTPEKPAGKLEPKPDNAAEKPAGKPEPKPDNAAEKPAGKPEPKPDNAAEKPAGKPEPKPDNAAEKPAGKPEPKPDNAAEKPAGKPEPKPDNAAEKPAGKPEPKPDNAAEKPAGKPEPKPDNAAEKPAGEKQPNKEEKPKQKAVDCGMPPTRDGATVSLEMGKNGHRAVYKCMKGYANIGGNNTTSECDLQKRWSPVDIACNNLTTCFALIGKRAAYHGTVAVTKSGLKCQRWDKQKPNRHWFGTSFSFKKTTGVGRETVHAAGDHCRDPGVKVSEKIVWCYTISSKVRWEACNIPKCQIP